MSDESGEITALKQTRWRTTISSRIERFSELLDNKTIASRYFGEKYVEALTNKINQTARTLLVLAIAYSILMLSLFAAQDSKKSEFEFFGYGFKNLGYHKEILLLLAASLSPISATLSGYQRYLVALRTECLKKIAPLSDVRDFYSNALVDNYFDALVKRYDYRTSSPHLATTTLTFLLVSIMILVVLTLLAGSFLLQLTVIYDVAINPSTSRFVNVIVVGYTLAAIFLAWTISLMQLPLPETDLTNYRRLTELQSSNPEKYKATMEAIASESSRREDAWSISIGFMASIATVAVLSFIIIGQSHNEVDRHLSQGLVAVFVSLLVAKPVADAIKRIAMRWFFRIYPDGAENRLRAFGTVKKILLAARVAAPALIAGLVVLIQHVIR